MQYYLVVFICLRGFGKRTGGEKANDIIEGAKHHYHSLKNEMTMRGLCYSKNLSTLGWSVRSS